MRETFCFDPDQIRPSRYKTLVHEHESWGNVRADLVKRTGLQRQETRIAHSRHTFLMNLKGEARLGENFIDGRRISFAARRPGSIVYIPAHSEWTGWDEGDATASYLLVSVEREFAACTLGEIASDRLAELPPSIGFRDGTIEMALQKIAIELKYPDPISVTMVESQAAQLFVRLVRLNGLNQEAVRGGLSSFDLKRAIGMIETSGHQRLSLGDLAREIGVTRFHFCRAFKQSTGMTPHAFIVQRRLKRSSDMLRSTDLSATEIALECGFGSSSHFAIAFKRAFGTSPTEFRRSCRV
ncbi:helix-turn-helix transcriptional regulator [Rhizobium leguminosarum]|uniref:helix-turn-helix transcriptional regulator n=1 Tax=Rhizobium leguminosarum TaxID=384 RepID=UPI001C944FF4|nr:AraC family transcriptional regulator [Rhizobium leguminosarum]MBY5775484.1 helix-turn-helix transcriptional regulator [Rhizobium leguminosarum]